MNELDFLTYFEVENFLLFWKIPLLVLGAGFFVFLFSYLLNKLAVFLWPFYYNWRAGSNYKYLRNNVLAFQYCYNIAKSVFVFNRAVLGVLKGFNIYLAERVISITGLLISPIAVLILVGLCAITRAKRISRRSRLELPRIVWGPYPNASSMDISRAINQFGGHSKTVVFYNFDRIWEPSDFDFCLTEFLKKYPRIIRVFVTRTIAGYFVFGNNLLKFDVFQYFFYPGYLRGTPLERIEFWFLRLAGCKSIAVSVGGDVAFMTDIKSHLIRQGFNDFYPNLTRNDAQDEIKKNIRFFTENADLIICQSSYMIDALPRWDILVSQYFPIDLSFWHLTEMGNADGRNSTVKIGHSPNHRPLKGSNFLINAVNELRKEGYKIELYLLENVKNKKVRDILSECDIVVGDLVLQGYSYMAIEGLALGKPVVQDISDEHYNRVFKLYTGLDEAPFVSSGIENLKHDLKKLIESPDLRREIGLEGRKYAEKYHSYEACNKFWTWVYDDVWFGTRPREAFYHPDNKISTFKSSHSVTRNAFDVLVEDAFSQSIREQKNDCKNKRFGFGPLNAETIYLIESLTKLNIIESNDYIFCSQNFLDLANPHWAQQVIEDTSLDMFKIDVLAVFGVSKDMNECWPDGLCFNLSFESLIK